MSRELLLLVDALAREKNVSKDIVFTALESALASATKKRINEEADVRVAVDRNTGDFESFRRWLVVPDEAVEDAAVQIGLTDAQQKVPDVQVEEYIEEPLEPIEVGRIGAVLPRDQMIPKENLRVCDRTRACLKTVERSARGPQLVLARTAP